MDYETLDRIHKLEREKETKEGVGCLAILVFGSLLGLAFWIHKIDERLLKVEKQLLEHSK